MPTSNHKNKNDYDLIFSRDLYCNTPLWNGDIYEGGCFDGIFEIEGSGDVIEEVEVTIINNVPAYIEGCVRDQYGNGADSLWIEAHCYEDCGNYWDNGVSQQTDSEGCYRLPIYSTGMWRVHVNNGGAEHKYMCTYDNYQ